MTTLDFEAMVERLEKMERQHRRMKHVGVAVVVLLAVGMGLASSNGVRADSQRITAHEFDVVDSQGRVRIAMKVSEPKGASTDAEIAMLDLSGKPRVSLSAIDNGIENLEFTDGTGNDCLRATGAMATSGLYLYGGPSVGPLGISPTGYGTQELDLYVTQDGDPAISLSDAKGFSMALGSTDLVTARTGETHHTSAASIAMFGKGKEHRVIWQAPSR